MGDRIGGEEGPSMGVGSYYSDHLQRSFDYSGDPPNVSKTQRLPARDYPQDQMDISVPSPGYARSTRLQFTMWLRAASCLMARTSP